MSARCRSSRTSSSSGDPRNVAAGDSYVRRALEALMDLGRHILAKGLGRVASEYRDISRQLLAGGVIDEETSQRMSDMAGYRNRLVHFYDEVTPRELHASALTASARSPG